MKTFYVESVIPGESRYMDAEVCILKESSDSRYTPLPPKTEKDLRIFASLFGWTVKVKANTLILVTDVPVGNKNGLED